jgi:hypothetical protein
MELFDDIKLIEEIAELQEKGIHKNYLGTIVKMEGDIYTVSFYNPKNLGEYAFAKVNKKYLTFVFRPHEKIIAETQEFIENVDMEKHVRLTECDVEELDAVELIVEDSKYTRHGVHKGDRGAVISTYAIDNHWEIIFSERGTGKDIAQIGVERKDFIIIDKF